MSTKEARGYYIDQFCERLYDETAVLAWKGALEACVMSNSGYWVQWLTLFELRKRAGRTWLTQGNC